MKFSYLSAHMSRRSGLFHVVLASVLVTTATALCLAVPASAVDSTSTRPHSSRSALHTVTPTSPVGKQLTWLLGISSVLPLTAKEESAHFDATFVDEEPVAKLNQAFESLGSTGSKINLLSLSDVTRTSLKAGVKIGSIKYAVQLMVDAKGLISGLFFSLAAPIPTPKVSSWSQITTDLKNAAPDVSFLAAQLTTHGRCSDLHEMSADTPRPLGSMFKLFVLGALANAVKDHAISWNQKLMVTSAVKVSGSGILQSDPNGTALSVEQTAIDMISVSDNTAADMLLALVGPSAVEAQVHAWSTHAALDDPFLSVAELFALKWHNFPTLANHYLALNARGRAAYLTSTVDKIPHNDITSSTSPRDVGTIEWFASPQDICHAFAGLSSLESEPGLNPLNTILDTNHGGNSLSATTWNRVWFKGGSEPGVLTLGYLARDKAGKTFVVVAMLENPSKPIASSATLLGLGVVTGALNLLQSD